MTNPHQDHRPILYVEDVHIGMAFATGTYFLDEQELISFASQFDPQPFHLDSAAATTSVFRGLAASGWHTAAVTMRLMVREGLRFAGGMIGVETALSWPAPVRPGDTLRVKGLVSEIWPPRPGSKAGRVGMTCETINQDNVVVQRLAAKLVVPIREATLAP